MAFSAVFEAGYFGAIALAYRGADLSLVYPLARGTAPVLLMLWSILFLNETLTLGGVLGILMITAGLYTVNLSRLGDWREPLRSLRRVGPRWAVAAGVCTSAYTAIDKIGIGYVPPLLYTYLALWMTLVLLTPWTLRLVGRAGLRAEIRSSRGGTVLAGFTTLAAYGLVLLAMSRGMPAAYAGALREISVIFGAAYGVLALKEQGGPMRVLGAGSRDGLGAAHRAHDAGAGHRPHLQLAAPGDDRIPGMTTLSPPSPRTIRGLTPFGPRALAPLTPLTPLSACAEGRGSRRLAERGEESLERRGMALPSPSSPEIHAPPPALRQGTRRARHAGGGARGGGSKVGGLL
jgi:uncharacterized membrane protein